MTSGVIPSTLGIVRRVAHVNAKEYAPKPRGPRAWVSSRVEIRLKAAWEAFSISVPMAAPSRPARTTARSRRGGERGWDRVGSALTVVSALTVNAPSLAREKSHNRNAGQPGGLLTTLPGSSLSVIGPTGRLRKFARRQRVVWLGRPRAGRPPTHDAQAGFLHRWRAKGGNLGHGRPAGPAPGDLHVPGQGAAVLRPRPAPHRGPAPQPLRVPLAVRRGGSVGAGR